MKGFLNVDGVLVPRGVIEDGQRFLRAAGAMGREGMVLWIGRRDGVTFTVTELVIPKQRGIRTHDGVCVILEEDELRRLNLDLYSRNLQLIAQVHSHPGAAYHSDMDNEYAIARVIGSLSIVVPDFAVRPFSISDCAIFRLTPKGDWKELSDNAVARLIRIAGEGYYGAC